MATELAIRDNVSVMQRPSAAYTLAEMRERVEALDAFYRGLMQHGTDYDEIPGTNKPTLLQPGAQLLCTYFGFAPVFESLPSTVEDWERGFFSLTIRCRLQRQDGSTVAEGIGSCNSKEDKYRWRNAKPTCPECGKEVRLSKNKPEWYCWTKTGGCGATFTREEITAVGKVENDEPWSLHNTILKMAEKRALVAATLNATGASRIFTQDVEDLPEFSRAAPVEDRRTKLIRLMQDGLAAVKALGGDPKEQDPSTMTDDEIKGMVKALAEMVERIKAAQSQQEPPSRPDENDAPF